jgi:hypothetical protein
VIAPMLRVPMTHFGPWATEELCCWEEEGPAMVLPAAAALAAVRVMKESHEE